MSFVEFRSGLRSLFARYSLCSSPSPLPFSVSLSPTLLLRSYLFARYVARYAFFLLFLDDKAFREMFFKELYRQLFFFTLEQTFVSVRISRARGVLYSFEVPMCDVFSSANELAQSRQIVTDDKNKSTKLLPFFFLFF